MNKIGKKKRHFRGRQGQKTDQFGKAKARRSIPNKLQEGLIE